MKRFFVILTAAVFLQLGCSDTSKESAIVGEYQAITEMEWTFAIFLHEGGDGEAVSSVYSEESDVTKRKHPCSWDVDGDVVTVRYHSGEIERFQFSQEVSFESAGLSGSAPGLMPIEGNGDYPISDGQVLWLAREVEARLEDLRSRQ